jgi:hypothetical protein
MELHQDPLLLNVEDCLSYVVNKNDKIGKTTYSMTMALGGKEEFLSILELVEKVCSKRVDTDGENIMKCLYRKDKSATLYVKIDGETEIYPPKRDDHVDHKKYQDKRFHLDAIIKSESIYVSDKTISIQVKL